MSLLNNYNNEKDKKNTIINLLNTQFIDKKNNKIRNEIVNERFNYNKPEIKSGLESLFEGNVKMPFGEDILFLQSEAIKAGPDLKRKVKKEWIHKTIEFS